jgi:hypothetical protein
MKMHGNCACSKHCVAGMKNEFYDKGKLEKKGSLVGVGRELNPR